jgi:DNA-binding ferritin-like protein
MSDYDALDDEQLAKLLEDEAAMVKALRKLKEQAQDVGDQVIADACEAAVTARLDSMLAIVAEMKARNQTGE